MDGRLPSINCFIKRKDDDYDDVDNYEMEEESFTKTISLYGHSFLSNNFSGKQPVQGDDNSYFSSTENGSDMMTSGKSPNCPVNGVAHENVEHLKFPYGDYGNMYTNGNDNNGMICQEIELYRDNDGNWVKCPTNIWGNRNQHEFGHHQYNQGGSFSPFAQANVYDASGTPSPYQAGGNVYLNETTTTTNQNGGFPMNSNSNVDNNQIPSLPTLQQQQQQQQPDQNGFVAISKAADVHGVFDKNCDRYSAGVERREDGEITTFNDKNNYRNDGNATDACMNLRNGLNYFSSQLPTPEGVHAQVNLDYFPREGHDFSQMSPSTYAGVENNASAQCGTNGGGYVINNNNNNNINNSAYGSDQHHHFPNQHNHQMNGDFHHFINNPNSNNNNSNNNNTNNHQTNDNEFNNAFDYIKMNSETFHAYENDDEIESMDMGGRVSTTTTTTSRDNNHDKMSISPRRQVLDYHHHHQGHSTPTPLTTSQCLGGRDIVLQEIGVSISSSHNEKLIDTGQINSSDENTNNNINNNNNNNNNSNNNHNNNDNNNHNTTCYNNINNRNDANNENQMTSLPVGGGGGDGHVVLPTFSSLLEAKDSDSSMSSSSSSTSSSNDGACDELLDDLVRDLLNSKGKKKESTYIALISRAIFSSPEKKMLLSDIYNYISKMFKFDTLDSQAWRNSVRHNLSLNECFVKHKRMGRGRGHYWSIHPACVEDFAKGDFRRRQARRLAQRNTKGSAGRSQNAEARCTGSSSSASRPHLSS